MPDRKFAVWSWSDRREGAESFEVEVRMTWPANVAGGTDPTFYIKHSDPPIRVSNGNLTDLRNEMDAAIRAFYAIDWKPKLVVTVGSVHEQVGKDWFSGDPEKLLDRCFGVHTEAWEEGVRANDGKVFFRRAGRFSNWAYNRKLADEVAKRRESEGGPDRGVTLGLIDDTPENRVALKAISDRLGELIDDLRSFLGSTELQENLTKLAGTMALPLFEEVPEA